MIRCAMFCNSSSEKFFSQDSAQIRFNSSKDTWSIFIL